jgi:hypothetical protein
MPCWSGELAPVDIALISFRCMVGLLPVHEEEGRECSQVAAIHIFVRLMASINSFLSAI